MPCASLPPQAPRPARPVVLNKLLMNRARPAVGRCSVDATHRAFCTRMHARGRAPRTC